jgi:hypothetical protein
VISLQGIPAVVLVDTRRVNPAKFVEHRADLVDSHRSELLITEVKELGIHIDRRVQLNRRTSVQLVQYALTDARSRP